MRIWLLTGVLVLLADNLPAAEWQLLVCGHGGNQQYRQRFADTAGELARAVADANTVVLCHTGADNANGTDGDPVGATVPGEDAAGGEPDSATVPEHQPNANPAADASGTPATLAALEEAFAELGERVAKDDLLVVTLIGHGTFDGHDYRFNLPGPDLSGERLAALLESVPTERQITVVLTSASGALLGSSAFADRTLLTATRNGSEQNAVEFDRFWAEAVTGAADADRDEIIILREAFDYAAGAVRDWYRQQRLLATEHPRLQTAGEFDDQVAIARVGALFGVMDNTEVRELLQMRQVIAAEIEDLKRRKPKAQSLEAYYDDLQMLLVRLARVQLRVDQVLNWQVNDG